MKLNPGDRCTYCGLPAQDRDHVIPLTYSSSQTRRRESDYTDENCVPSCRECNNTANARVFDSLEEKRDYIQQKLGYKYRSISDFPDWTPEEIAEMGSAFRRPIQYAMALKRLTQRRLSWPYVPYEVDELVEQMLSKLGTSLDDKKWLRGLTRLGKVGKRKL